MQHAWDLWGLGDVYSCLENLMDRRAWQATVSGVAKTHPRAAGIGRRRAPKTDTSGVARP